MRLNIITEYSGDVITQRVEGADNGTSSLTKQVLNLKEEGVRQALIELGWTPPEKVKHIAVVAGSYNEFNQHRALEKNKEDGNRKLYHIDSITKAQGIRFDDVELIGTYYKRTNLQDLLEAIHSRMKG